MKIHTRAEWGASAGDGNGARPLPATESYLHHSVTKQLTPAASLADEAAQMRAIEAIGVERFGAAYGFPYTFAVFPSGRVYAGHDVAQKGAHTAGHNTTGIGIVWPGNYEDNAPSSAQIRATAELLVALHKSGKLTSSRLTGGHRDTKATACPGRYAYARLDEIRKLAASAAAAAAPVLLDTAGRYTVRAGDTLDGIAARARTSVDALILLNGISDPDRVAPGDVVFTRWVVGRGDTLGEIASATDTTVATLVTLNGIRNADTIQIGALIRLP